jgi:hypothetical protein
LWHFELNNQACVAHAEHQALRTRKNIHEPSMFSLSTSINEKFQKLANDFGRLRNVVISDVSCRNQVLN